MHRGLFTATGLVHNIVIRRKCQCLSSALCDQWIKSVDICSLNSNNEVVAYSGYPVTVDENTANVSLQEKLSRDAFCTCYLQYHGVP